MDKFGQFCDIIGPGLRSTLEVCEKTLMKQKKTCKNGHIFYKSSDCPTCPICENACKPGDGFLTLLVAQARRVLERTGINTLEQLSKLSESEVLTLHGMGLVSIPKLRKALEAGIIVCKRRTRKENDKQQNSTSEHR